MSFGKVIDWSTTATVSGVLLTTWGNTNNGDPTIGKQSNTLDRYQCPGCSGAMVKMVDSKQRHICYETCGSCNGSFFDASEFRDLSELTISDSFDGHGRRWRH
jgi:hypothetical protein